MKIKSDFITNSSAVAFIICIPENFDIPRERIENILVERTGHDLEEFSTEDFILVEQCLNVIIDKGWLHQQEIFEICGSDKTVMVWEGLIGIIELEKDIIVFHEQELSQSGSGWIEVCPREKIKNIFLKLYKDDFIETMDKITEGKVNERRT